MKRGAPDHPKMLALQAALRIPKPYAVGLLELLWHFTAKFAPDGQIGRWPDRTIARALGWGGDTQRLVSALVRCGWIDESVEGRLIVHDWFDHIDQSTQRLLDRQKNKMASQKLDMASQKLDMTSLPVPVPVPVPVPEPIKATTSSVAPGSSEFDLLWKACAKKIGKGKARKAYLAAKKRAGFPGLEAVQNALERLQKADQWTREGRQYQPHLATWLNRDGWEDELEPSSQPLFGDDEAGEEADHLSALMQRLERDRPELVENGRRNLAGVVRVNS